MSSSGSRASIPNAVKKVILNLKEITGNTNEEEIYGMLKEYEMDPNETAQKLLLQGIVPHFTLTIHFPLLQCIIVSSETITYKNEQQDEKNQILVNNEVDNKNECNEFKLKFVIIQQQITKRK